MAIRRPGDDRPSAWCWKWLDRLGRQDRFSRRGSTCDVAVSLGIERYVTDGRHLANMGRVGFGRGWGSKDVQSAPSWSTHCRWVQSAASESDSVCLHPVDGRDGDGYRLDCGSHAEINGGCDDDIGCRVCDRDNPAKTASCGWVWLFRALRHSGTLPSCASYAGRLPVVGRARDLHLGGRCSRTQLGAPYVSGRHRSACSHGQWIPSDSQRGGHRERSSPWKGSGRDTLGGLGGCRAVTMETALYITSGVLWVLVIGLAVSVVRVQRSVEALWRAIEGRSAEGPKVGSPAPELSGDPVVGRGPEDGRGQFGGPLVLWFMSVGCRPCRTLRGTVQAIANEYDERVRSAITCVGSEQEVAAFADGLSEECYVLADPTRVNASAWGVFITPFVVVVDSQGVVRRKLAEIAIEPVRLALDSVLEAERRRRS